jgi:hypothetical protein
MFRFGAAEPTSEGTLPFVPPVSPLMAFAGASSDADLSAEAPPPSSSRARWPTALAIARAALWPEFTIEAPGKPTVPIGSPDPVSAPLVDMSVRAESAESPTALEVEDAISAAVVPDSLRASGAGASVSAAERTRTPSIPCPSAGWSSLDVA